MNLHGFGDIRNNQNRPPPPPQRNYRDEERPQSDDGIMQRIQEPVIEDHLRIADQHKVLFVSGRIALKNPRDQHFWDMLSSTLCPTFKLCSITFLIILADLAMMIFELSVGLQKSSTNLLQVKTQTVLDYGGNFQPYLLKGQVYRYISPIFLHWNFMHIFSNLITTFIILSKIQYTFGPWKTLLIYLISGIAGNVFSALCKPEDVKAGASTSLFGIIGLIIGYIVINWEGFDLLGPALKCQIFCTGFTIILFIFIFTPSTGGGSGSVDYYGHLGGFLAGVWLSSIHETIINTSRQKIFRIIFGSLILIQLALCFVLFHTTQKAYM